jgi:hypothetical protein
MFSYTTNDKGAIERKSFLKHHIALSKLQIKLFLQYGWEPSTVAHPKTHNLSILGNYENFLEEACIDHAIGIVVDTKKADRVVKIFKEAIERYPPIYNDFFTNVTRVLYTLLRLLVAN